MRPSKKEEEYIARQEFEQLKKSEAEKRLKLAEIEQQAAQELHWMKCPKCGLNLVEIDYKHIKVDKCTYCEGIWLDAGEMEHVAKMDKSGLDKLFSVFKK